jgi:hypothetical protein
LEKISIGRTPPLHRVTDNLQRSRSFYQISRELLPPAIFNGWNGWNVLNKLKPMLLSRFTQRESLHCLYPPVRQALEQKTAF